MTVPGTSSGFTGRPSRRTQGPPRGDFDVFSSSTRSNRWTRATGTHRPSHWIPPQAVLTKKNGLRALLRNGPRLGGGPAANAARLPCPGASNRAAELDGVCCLQRQRGWRSYSNPPYKPATRPAGAFLGGPGGLFFSRKDGPREETENKRIISYQNTLPDNP